jgi:hypothetical protein
MAAELGAARAHPLASLALSIAQNWLLQGEGDDLPPREAGHAAAALALAVGRRSGLLQPVRLRVDTPGDAAAAAARAPLGMVQLVLPAAGGPDALQASAVVGQTWLPGFLAANQQICYIEFGALPLAEEFVHYRLNHMEFLSQMVAPAWNTAQIVFTSFGLHLHRECDDADEDDGGEGFRHVMQARGLCEDPNLDARLTPLLRTSNLYCQHFTCFLCDEVLPFLVHLVEEGRICQLHLFGCDADLDLSGQPMADFAAALGDSACCPERLEITCDSSTESEGQEFHNVLDSYDMERLLAALGSCASREVKLRHFSSSDVPALSTWTAMEDFSILMLWDDYEHDGYFSQLPASVRRVTITSAIAYLDEHSLMHVADLIRSRAERLPLLESITVECIEDTWDRGVTWDDIGNQLNQLPPCCDEPVLLTMKCSPLMRERIGAWQADGVPLAQAMLTRGARLEII